jgi:hypothetical protein
MNINAIITKIGSLQAINANDIMSGGSPPSLQSILGLFIGLFNTFAFAIAPIILVVIIVFAGAKRLIGAENPASVSESNAMIMWSIIGTFLLYASVLIVNLVAGVVGQTTGLP